MLCCSPPASSSTPLRPSVYYPSISLVVNTMRVRALCDHLCPFLCFRPYLYRLEVRLDLYGANPAPRSKGRTSVPSSALPRFLLPSFPPSSSLPCFLLPPLPHFLPPASLPLSIQFHATVSPPSPLSIPAVRIELQSKQVRTRMSFRFKYKAFNRSSNQRHYPREIQVLWSQKLRHRDNYIVMLWREYDTAEDSEPKGNSS